MMNAFTPSGPSGIPVTWDALIAQHREPLFEGLAQFRELPHELAEIRDDPLVTDPVGESLLGASGMFAQAAIVYGPDACAPYWSSVLPLLPEAFAEIGETVTRDNRVLASSLLSLVNAARCCGAELPTDTQRMADVAERDWPTTLAGFTPQMNERERWTTAFAALVARDFEAVVAVVGGGSIDSSVDPGATFEFNTQGYVRHLSAAVKNRASLPDVLPALRNFVARFPHKVAAGTLSWDHLLYAGRIVFSVIGDEPPAASSRAMFAIVNELAFGGAP